MHLQRQIGTEVIDTAQILFRLMKGNLQKNLYPLTD